MNNLSILFCALAVASVALNAVADNAAAPAPAKVRNFEVCSMHPSQMKIFISTRHTFPEYTAALELQRVMRACVNYGQERHAEIVAADKLPEDSPAIVVGSMDSALVQPYAKKLKLVASKDDEIAHYVIGKHLFIVGNSPRAALYSVIDFMRFRMGVYDLFPEELGSFYTKAGSGASVPGDLAYNYEPAFRFRMINGLGNAENGAFFAARNFMQATTCASAATATSEERRSRPGAPTSKMLKTSVTIPIYSGSGDDDFDAAGVSAKTSLHSPNNQPPINETDMRFYWTAAALHVRVECLDPELTALAPVAAEPRDTAKL